jgi:hypothetical protein
MIVSMSNLINTTIKSYNCIHRQLHPVEFVTDPTRYISESDIITSISMNYELDLKCDLSNENCSIDEYSNVELYDC